MHIYDINLYQQTSQDKNDKITTMTHRYRVLSMHNLSTSKKRNLIKLVFFFETPKKIRTSFFQQSQMKFFSQKV